MDTDETELFWNYADSLYEESREAWFRFESMRQRLMRRLGLCDEDALELVCKLLLLEKA